MLCTGTLPLLLTLAEYPPFFITDHQSGNLQTWRSQQLKVFDWKVVVCVLGAFTPEYCRCLPQEPSCQPLSLLPAGWLPLRYRCTATHTPSSALSSLWVCADASSLLSLVDASDQDSGEFVFLANQPCKDNLFESGLCIVERLFKPIPHLPCSLLQACFQ